MPRINLLPWREAERKRKRQEFLAGVGGAAVVALLLGVGAMFQYDQAIDHQNERNQLLTSTIEDVNRQIAEVLGLEEQQQRLEARMDVIEQLQRSRPGVVHLFEQLVRIMPDGVHLTSFKQTNDRVEFRGQAQSSTRVAALMRSIESSEWLAEPALVSTENKSTKVDVGFEFTLTAKLTGAAAAVPPTQAKKKPARNS